MTILADGDKVLTSKSTSPEHVLSNLRGAHFVCLQSELVQLNWEGEEKLRSESSQVKWVCDIGTLTALGST